jgi:C1A family cysteine protease
VPIRVDLREEMPPVLDQKNCGSCASNATSNALRHLLKKEKLPEFQPSRLYLYWNTRVNIEHSPPKEDTGVCIRDVCKAIQKYHACDENIWPYDTSKFSIPPPLNAYRNANLHKEIKYAYVPQDLNIIKKTIASGYPIVIGIQIYDSFETEEVIKTGIVPMPNVENETCLGGHAILLTSYNDLTKTFIIQNSWGESVGEKGYFHVPYDYVLNPALACDFWVFQFFD